MQVERVSENFKASNMINNRLLQISNICNILQNNIAHRI